MRDEYGNEKHDGAVNASRQLTYASPNDAPMEAGKVLAIAGGAAGALAGLWVLLSEREKKQEPKTALEQAKAMIEEAAHRAREERGHAQSAFLSNLEGLTSDARTKNRKTRKKAAKASKKAGKKAESDVNETIEKIAQFLRDAREEAATMVASESDKVGAAAKTLRKDASKKADEARKASKGYSREAKKEADRARGELAGIAGLLKSKVADAEHVAEDYVGGVVLPKVRELGHDAQGLVETGKGKSEELRKRAEKDVLPEAKKRAEDLRKAGEHLIPEAKKVAEDLRKKAEAELLPEAKKRAEMLGHTVEAQAKTARTAIESGVDVVESQASAAGEAVKQGGRETKSLLLWIALAGVLIFTVFMDDEQQNRLKEIAVEVFGEARDMYADMKGEDTFDA